MIGRLSGEREMSLLKLFSGARAALLVAAVSALAASLAGPASATTRVEKTFGKWVVTCVDSDAGARTCSMTQQIAATAPAHGAILIAVVRGSKAQQTLALLVPTGVSLKDGVTLTLGDPPTSLAYNQCGPRVCATSMPLDAKVLTALKGSPKVIANYVLGNKKLVQATIDLATFGDGYTYFASQLQ
jgi:invasion protein IalB